MCPMARVQDKLKLKCMDRKKKMVNLLILASLALSFVNQGESVTPRLIISSPAVHIRVGYSITISCSIFDLEDDFFTQDGSIVFFRHGKNNDRVQLSYYTPTNSSTTSSRYKISGIQRNDRYAVDLQITEIVQEDASQYQCATYRSGAFEKGSTELNLQWLQTAPIEYPKCDAHMHNGLLHLHCESMKSVPPPDLVWFHNGVEVRRKTELKYSLHSNKLIITPTDVNGTYECRFYYVGGGINDERSCRIEKPNIMVVSPASTEFVAGSDAKMKILARANPPMRTVMNCKWDHGNTCVFSVQTDGNDFAMITIRNIDLTMNGSQITCCGRNYLGDSCQSTSIVVKESGTSPCVVTAASDGNDMIPIWSCLTTNITAFVAVFLLCIIGIVACLAALLMVLQYSSKHLLKKGSNL